ncbi:MAG: hypothetical protein D6E12_11895 [Desulfovibrio sp.]|nr:MAG: hypothetical protein D6E12_11895 [Desulfovibrio sp.]
MKHLLLFLVVLALFGLACQPMQSSYQRSYEECEFEANRRNLVGSERQAFMDGCMNDYNQNQQQYYYRTPEECEMEANQRNLIGYNREAFIQDCINTPIR